MKILYAIQGTGNGHLSRAREIIPILKKMADVDILVSGTQSDIALPFPITYQFKGMSFVFGKDGGIDMPATYLQLSTRTMMNDISKLPVQEYNLILNDFEPVSAWACRQRNKPCISLSHQCAVLNKHAPKPKRKDFIGKAVLNFYAPTTHSYGFHFHRYDKNIFTPVIRSEVRTLPIEDRGHYTVYLPSYDDTRIIKMLKNFGHINWEVFSKHTNKCYVSSNVCIQPIENDKFLGSMASSKGVLCGAGFETPAEALFLKKKLAVIPMKMQYEQQCNAAALKDMGVPVFKSLKEKHHDKIADWLLNRKFIKVDYPDMTEQILQHIIQQHTTKSTNTAQDILKEISTLSY
jgi:uncharacterized protein (TIGR00661 family)